MRSKISQLFTFQGTIGPRQYLMTGCAAFVLKYCVDSIAAALLLHEPWKPWQYLNPVGTTASLLALGGDEKRFFLVMSLIALPFIWLGVSLTIRRLRSLQAPLAVVILFFVPFVNLLFFLLLSIVLPKENLGLPQIEPSSRSRMNHAVLAVLIAVPVCLAAVWLGADLLTYGLGLFIATPFCLGLVSVMIFTLREPRTLSQCAWVAIFACVVPAFVLLCFAFEGLICILMAAPIALPLALLGGYVGFQIQWLCRSPRESVAMLLLVSFYSPAMIGTESKVRPPAPEFAVNTSVEVDAPPERVWQNVVSFSQLPEPRELLFRSGIAYPIRAEIHGRGVGAVRYCQFSTGPFVEPVTVWDEPRLLEFSVAHNPAPMHELSPYSDLHPPHLDGFFVSHKGHFSLTALPGGRTRLEGVTWYQHTLWPTPYWRIWSDFIIHRIHLRVLNHVKSLSEKPQA
ncbi:MAG: hypothetical protein JWO13_2708 [Acidobacteriales bacterium]|nr:hypothetical protein [Terriglobales bacterium]